MVLTIFVPPESAVRLMLVVTTLLLGLHLVWMLFASGLPAVWAVVQFFPSLRGSERVAACGRIGAVKSVYAFVVATAIGIVLGLLQHWTGRRDYGVVWELWPRKILWGSAELGFHLLAVWLWIWGWPRAPGFGWRNWVHAAWGCVLASNLLYHFPPLMAAISQIASAPQGEAERVLAQIPLPLATDPELAARTVHFLGGAIVVAAVALASIAWKRQEDDAAVGALRQIAAGLGLLAGLVQMATGIWLLAVLPTYRQNQLTGHDMVLTGLMVAGVGGALLLLRQLLRLSEADISKADMAWTWCALAVTILGMAGVG